MGQIYEQKVDSLKPVIDKLAGLISSNLRSGKKVLWLISGGSAIPIAIEVAKLLREDQLDLLSKLTVSLVDERYGPVDYAYSNWHQLMESGFNAEPAKYIPVLDGLTFEITTHNFEQSITKMFSENQVKIGSFGIGADGHTAGILPESIAVNEDSKLVTSYEGPDYERITITSPAIAQMDFILVYAAGDDKAQVVQKLINSDLPISEQPAQLLKQAKELYLYTDR